MANGISKFFTSILLNNSYRVHIADIGCVCSQRFTQPGIKLHTVYLEQVLRQDSLHDNECKESVAMFALIINSVCPHC